MALYPVEGAFVARAVGNQALLGPVAHLDAAVLPDQLVLLLGQACGYPRLDARNRTLHDKSQSLLQRVVVFNASFA